jgi:hypothetical protein
MARRRPFLLAAVLLLLVSAFGGLSVGVPILFNQLVGTGSAGLDAQELLVPAGFLGYGLLSLVGAIAILSGWSSATRLVVVPQGLVAVGLLWVDVAIVADVSLLLVAGIAAGSVLFTLADVGTRYRP